MLHGRGSDEHDLFGLKSHLDPRLDIYSLRAPFEFDWGGYTWFDLFEDGSVDEKSFLHSKNEILSFLAPLKTEKLFLLGFSMGAIMSYAIALTQPKLCAGILALSGFAPKELEPEYKLNELQDLSIFISHGLNDPVIPIASARKTNALLSTSNAHVTYSEYPMAHQINDECLGDIQRWLRDRL
ncbi:MAG: dienelactone hydrolase family protein [Bacteroidota bacterium]